MRSCGVVVDTPLFDEDLIPQLRDKSIPVGGPLSGGYSILILSVFLALALWYLLEHAEHCGYDGYMENGVCVYE